MLLVGVMTIRDEHFAAHIGKVDVLRPFAAAAVEKEGFVFPNVLVSDYSTGKTRRGSGTAFLNAAAKFARDNGKGTLFVDCFANSTGKLVEYYESRGFNSVADFEVPRKDWSIWPGVFFRLDFGDETE